MKKLILFFFATALLEMVGCGPGSPKADSTKTSDSTGNSGFFHQSHLTDGKPANDFLLSYFVKPVKISFYLPAIQSFATGSSNGVWAILGGETSGYHGTSFNPPPFPVTVANDSMWAIDPVYGKSWGVPVPAKYWNLLSASNPQYYQSGKFLYFCGGFTVSDEKAARLNTTSDYFFEINLYNLITYITTKGQTPVLDSIFTKVIKNPFVKVTGGEMFVENGYFYLIGGQDFEGTYSPASSGAYTYAIRKFTVKKSGSNWIIADTSSLIDPVNLHRRDFNLLPVVVNGADVEAILNGGVFTKNGGSYNNPIHINGLATGSPVITVDTMNQLANQYSCATIPIWAEGDKCMYNGFLGGISYVEWDSKLGKLVIGDKIGNAVMPMPFSNLISWNVSTMKTSYEVIQVPPKLMLPGYLGSNAKFLPLPKYMLAGHPDIIDGNKIVVTDSMQVQLGYMYGGILSNGPTSGTTPSGHVNTYSNPVLYKVYFKVDVPAQK